MPFPFTRSTFDHWKEKYDVHPTNATLDLAEVGDGGNGVVWEKVVAYISIPLFAVISILVLVKQNLDRLNQFGYWCSQMFDRVRDCIDRYRARNDTTYEMADAPPLPAPRLSRQNRTDSERVRTCARARETCV